MGRRIALVCAGDAGIGEHVAAVAEGLTDRGDRVAILGTEGHRRRLDSARTGVRFASVPITRQFAPAADLAAAWTLRALLRGPSGNLPDVVHAFGPRAGLVASLSRLRGVPLAVTWWEDVETGGAGWWPRVVDQANRLVARSGDVALCDSNDLVTAVLRLGSADARQLPLTVTETVDTTRVETSSADPVEHLDALYRELTGR